MSPRIKNKASKKTRDVVVDQPATAVLRDLRNEEAFRFYEGVDKPTGECARSLLDFLDKVSTVRLECLRFHLERKDFQNWIEGTLGDSKLAGMMAKIAPAEGERLRVRLQETVESRLQELKGALVSFEVREGLTIKR